MSSDACIEWVDRLPDWVGRRLKADEAQLVEEHVRACADCAAEAAMIRALWAARPEAPADLVARVSEKLRGPLVGAARPRGARRWPVWATSAAAVLVLAVGTYVLGTPAAPDVSGLGQIAAEEGSVWISDDGIVAGAPLLDELTDDALVALLEEMGG